VRSACGIEIRADQSGVELVRLALEPGRAHIEFVGSLSDVLLRSPQIGGAAIGSGPAPGVDAGVEVKGHR
jgi:hypothetical protein